MLKSLLYIAFGLRFIIHLNNFILCIAFLVFYHESLKNTMWNATANKLFLISFFLLVKVNTLRASDEARKSQVCLPIFQQNLPEPTFEKFFSRFWRFLKTDHPWILNTVSLFRRIFDPLPICPLKKLQQKVTTFEAKTILKIFAFFDVAKSFSFCHLQSWHIQLIL